MNKPARPLHLISANPLPAGGEHARRWKAVVEKDRRQDGAFLFAVKTTGIFCRPSCPARTPLRKNVEFFDSVAEARAAGFRACRRCKPEGPSACEVLETKVREACEWLKQAEERVGLEALAARAGLSPHHFHRSFKSMIGVTPREFQAELRAQRVREGLAKSETVTNAAYDAGFSSSARFYDAVDESIGMQPARFREGGRGERIRYAVTPTRLGKLLVAATGRGICAVEFGDSAKALEGGLFARFPGALRIEADDEFQNWLDKVVAVIERGESHDDLPIDIRGTAFQRKVWNALRTINRGKTASYAEVANRIGQPNAHRAVASACANNVLAVLVPCHRVVRADGALSGYRWGVERKAALLESERDAAPKKIRRTKN
jgi:AraC family transcriptional regulator of adaptative response/methylated-DNA-[protein]-cysteine methyltransferase